MSLKLRPPDSAEVWSFSCPMLFTMLIRVGLKSPIADPFAVALLKVTVPKLASGRTLPAAGASAMASAEEFAAPLSDLLTVCFQPRVTSCSTSV